MIGSQLYTVKSGWRIATADIYDFEQNSPIYNERFELSNRIFQRVQGEFADLVAEYYTEDTDMVPNKTGRRYSSGASYVSATRTLTATMDTAFTANDKGKAVVITNNTGPLIYLCSVDEYVSATSITVKGDVPPADIATVNDVRLIGSTLIGDSVDISSLKLLRYSNLINRFTIFSTETDFVDVLSSEAYRRFPTTAPANRNRIVWNLVGDNVYLKTALTSYGTLTFRGPRICAMITADTDRLPLLDGAMVQIGLIALKQLIISRMPPGTPNDKDRDKAEMMDAINALYRSKGINEKENVIKDKAEALL
jgi:hypothetical protein